jgi:hypothetical protein
MKKEPAARYKSDVKKCLANTNGKRYQGFSKFNLQKYKELDRARPFLQRAKIPRSDLSQDRFRNLPS